MEAMRRWLKTPLPILGNETPLSYSDTGPGAERHSAANAQTFYNNWLAHIQSACGFVNQWIFVMTV